MFSHPQYNQQPQAHHYSQQLPPQYQPQPQPQQQQQQLYKNDEEFHALEKSFGDVAQTNDGYVVRFPLSQKPEDKYVLFMNYLARSSAYDAPAVYVYPKCRSSRILDANSCLCNHHLLDDWPTIKSCGFPAANLAYSIYRYFTKYPPCVSMDEARAAELESEYPVLNNLSDSDLQDIADNPSHMKSFVYSMADVKGIADEVAALTKEVKELLASIDGELIPTAHRLGLEVEAKKKEAADLKAEYERAFVQLDVASKSIDVVGAKAKLSEALNEIDRELRALKGAGAKGNIDEYTERYKALNVAYYRVKLMLNAL